MKMLRVALHIVSYATGLGLGALLQFATPAKPVDFKFIGLLFILLGISSTVALIRELDT
jgi:hypothetical protein